MPYTDLINAIQQAQDAVDRARHLAEEPDYDDDFGDIVDELGMAADKLRTNSATPSTWPSMTGIIDLAGDDTAVAATIAATPALAKRLRSLLHQAELLRPVRPIEWLREQAKNGWNR